MAFEGHPNKLYPFGRFVNNTIGDGIISNIFPVFRHKISRDDIYWKYALTSDKIMRNALSRTSKYGIMMFSLDYQMLGKEIIKNPEINEQISIGKLLCLLDSFITLHHRELKW